MTDYQDRIFDDEPVDQRRLIWTPEFDVHPVVAVGQEWPDFVACIKWERNLLGERRYVGARTYSVAKGTDYR